MNFGIRKGILSDKGLSYLRKFGRRLLKVISISKMIGCLLLVIEKREQAFLLPDIWNTLSFFI